MAYALTIVITLFFLALYILLRKKPREKYSRQLNEDEFSKEAQHFVRALPSPIKGSTIEDKQIKRRIRFIRFRLKSRRFNGIFSDFIEAPNILSEILKADFSTLSQLCSIDEAPRIVMLADFLLSHTSNIFTNDRWSVLANEQNKVHTLCFNEIMHLREGFLYALLQKTAFLYENLYTIAKVIKISDKYVKEGGQRSQNKTYKSYGKSKLFIDICQIRAGYKQHNNTLLDSKLDELYLQYTTIIQSMQDVLAFDFSRYYTPLELLDKYDSFSRATTNQKINFLTLLQELSDKEGLDELMYTIRLEKYLSSATMTRTGVKRIKLKSRAVCVLTRKRDISMLAGALSSNMLMQLFFSDKSQSCNKSISKIADFENTFEPIYKFNNLNFGISTKDNILRINPHLPCEILRADLTFSNNGTYHTMHLIRSKSSAVFLGGTEITGTHYIRLADKPLDITVKISD